MKIIEGYRVYNTTYYSTADWQIDFWVDSDFPSLGLQGIWLKVILLDSISNVRLGLWFLHFLSVISPSSLVRKHTMLYIYYSKIRIANIHICIYLFWYIHWRKSCVTQIWTLKYIIQYASNHLVILEVNSFNIKSLSIHAYIVLSHLSILSNTIKPVSKRCLFLTSRYEGLLHTKYKHGKFSLLYF